MTNANRCSAAAAFAARKRLSCVLPSETSLPETSGQFFGERGLQSMSPATESSAREDYESNMSVLVSYTTLAFLLDYFRRAPRPCALYSLVQRDTRH